jgi:cell division protein FtsA
VTIIGREQIVVGIDVGTTKICTLIAAVDADLPEILGVGICPSQGIRKGVVVDVQAAVESMASSLQRAEQQSGFKAMSAYVGIAGGHIQSTNSHAVVPVRSAETVVSAEDVSRVLEGARVIPLPPDQEILHVVPHHFVVDGMDGIRDPVGMVGRRLEVEANIVTASTTSIHNLRRCVESIGIDLDDLVLEPLAAGQVVLTPEERDFGVTVIDIGGGTTDAAVFHDGSVIHTCILPVGGTQISNDIAFGLRATFPFAEELKIRYGSTVSHAKADGEMVSVAPLGADAASTVEQRTLAEIIDARLAETFEMVQSEIARAGFADCYPSGVVLTGGSSQIAGATALAREIFGVPARMGTPLRLNGLADTVRGPAFATSIGLLAWGQEQLVATHRTPSGLAGIGHAVKAWLRNFFV